MKEEDKPWVRVYDAYGEPDGLVMGNRSGLAELKKKIEQTLDEGESSAEGLNADFEKICMTDDEPEERKEGPSSLKDYAGLVVLGILACIFIAGVVKLFEIIQF